ncbi:MAG: NDP-hexose 4-ketoreductase [Cryptosporangiaceae bacterium]|nr:NDP-hexose 4-ketoreductase [Cryptosporangiaceae bacterium]
MRVLLFGANGFLGAPVRERLAAEAGVEVLTGGRSPLADVRADLATVGADALAELVRRASPHAVINCTGATSGDAPALVAANVIAVATLANAVLRGAPSARLVHFGSAGEYGRVTPGEATTEATPARPQVPYGVTKLAGTEILRSAREHDGLDAVVLRVFNPVGPDAPASTLPGRLARELRLAAGPVTVGPLDAYRDFVDTRDVADAAVRVALASGGLPAVLNVGTGKAVLLRDLAKELTALAGEGAEIAETGSGSERSSDVPWQQADISAIRAATGWAPRRALSTSLLDLWLGGRA